MACPPRRRVGPDRPSIIAANEPAMPAAVRDLRLAPPRCRSRRSTPKERACWTIPGACAPDRLPTPIPRVRPQRRRVRSPSSSRPTLPLSPHILRRCLSAASAAKLTRPPSPSRARIRQETTLGRPGHVLATRQCCERRWPARAHGDDATGQPLPEPLSHVPVVISHSPDLTGGAACSRSSVAAVLDTAEPSPPPTCADRRRGYLWSPGGAVPGAARPCAGDVGGASADGVKRALRPVRPPDPPEKPGQTESPTACVARGKACSTARARSAAEPFVGGGDPPARRVARGGTDEEGEMWSISPPSCGLPPRRQYRPPRQYGRMATPATWPLRRRQLRLHHRAGEGRHHHRRGERVARRGRGCEHPNVADVAVVSDAAPALASR